MMRTVARQVQKGLGQIRQTFLGRVARGGSRLLQVVGFADETLEEIELFQHVGFSSHIPEDARVVLLPLAGKTARSIIIATTDGLVSVDAAEGETCIYDQFGHSILLHENGIKLKGNTEVDGELHVTKNIKSDAEVSDKTSSMAQMRVVYNIHVHGNSPQPSEKME
ncbi:phage baseplate assembly protein [Acinetobacter sp. V102_4]|uniref:phage baseplate assembly protein domain-containing protein n=1 Tax=Acinetobacter sp. V102_4 TaxID=3072984 RepID=UPI00287F322D|nr:phage baseplate assembly protein [Acinetobacter sp. V102_4]MDS7929631.1 phage baseplate assembly protein [Acinetobacter sp. V102_4]